MYQRWPTDSFFGCPISESPMDRDLDPISDSSIVSIMRQSDIQNSDSSIAEKITLQ